jgi:uncharacterized protein YkwD
MLLLPLTAQAQVAPCPQNEINGVFQLTNQYRAMYRQAPVQWSQILGSVAYGHAYWMASANLLSHMDAYGMRVRDRVTRAGYGEFITTVAENIAAGQGTAVQVMEDWKRSPMHNMALLLPDVREIGIACFLNAQRKPFWVLVVADKLALPR